jgi:hypothetical protein
LISLAGAQAATETASSNRIDFKNVFIFRAS